MKALNCVEMKRRIQEKAYEKTRNMSREEYSAFIRYRVDEGHFGGLLKKYTVKHK